mgnify:CR=1 FL=1
MAAARAAARGSVDVISMTGKVGCDGRRRRWCAVEVEAEEANEACERESESEVKVESATDAGARERDALVGAGWSWNGSSSA